MWVTPGACVEPGDAGGLVNFQDAFVPCSDCDGKGSTCGGHWRCSTCTASGWMLREELQADAGDA